MKIGIDARFYGGVLGRVLGEYGNILMHIRIQSAIYLTIVLITTFFYKCLRCDIPTFSRILEYFYMPLKYDLDKIKFATDASIFRKEKS